MASSKDFEDLENDFISADYEKNLEEKQIRKLYISNFLETKEQSKVSSLGGSMFSLKVANTS